MDGVTVSTDEGRSIKGVAVTIPGICDGIGVQTGKDCGNEPQVSHAASANASKGRAMIFFIGSLYSGAVVNPKRGRHFIY